MSAHARRAIAQRQRQKQIQNILASNNHTMLIMNSAEFVDYIISVKMKQGYSRSQAVEWIDEQLQEYNSVSNKWERIKDDLKFGAGLYPLFDDVKSLTVLAMALKNQGNVFGKFKIKVYNGSPAIIIDSYPRIREHLTGTRYLASNPKLFTVGVGRLEAAKSMKGGFIVTLIISVTFHALDQVLRDEKTWHDFVAGVAVDMAIVAASIAVSAMAIGITTAAGVAVVTAAAVPLLVVVVVGILTTVVTSIFGEEINILAASLADELRLLEEKVITGVIKLTPNMPPLEKVNCNYGDYFYSLFGIPNVNIKTYRDNLCRF
ncbi:hypothetical protein GBO14_10185 [Pseudoalteromonas shioyasakiensis]|uniref:hypothetical protein n=1 Tax=Pseudoalteromonas TaxID=53246 RepID=UPI00203F08C5|nr:MULTISPECIES: hypothetical protein [Pseudoalteromonas]MCO6355083.1 hypothetical protein [Pseudoalteromonas shioyasakiensis]GKW54011.1 hypothetical protein NCCP2140_30640 [Pseudoalteromonas sp. NCCP-2140]